MIAKIVAILGATNAGLVLQTTLSICAVFFISYVLVFLLTSRSYRKIVVRQRLIRWKLKKIGEKEITWDTFLTKKTEDMILGVTD